MATRLNRENWMSHLNPNVRILDSYIPASHDSSCYPTADVFQMFKNEWVGAVTQLAPYTSQLNAGVRYFDMRVAWHNGDLYMHHNTSWFYEKFVDVLRQINNFAHEHPQEVIFMDVDFDKSDQNLEIAILNAMEHELDNSLFSTAHLNNNGTFNTQITWGGLQGKQLLVTWTSTNTYGRPWLSTVDNFRWSPYDDFDKKEALEILQCLSGYENQWSKDKIFIAQVINTPLASFITPPGECDADAEQSFNSWIESHGAGCNLNVIMRDFVNVGYNRDVLDFIIRLNQFSSSPEKESSGVPIHLEDNVMLCTLDNQYVRVDGNGKVTLTNFPDDLCSFKIRDYDYNNTNNFVYSGNLNADTQNCQGNFRIVPNNNNPDGLVLSINSDGYVLYQGIGWGPCGDDETFTCFAPDDLSCSDNINSGDEIIIRCMVGASSNVFEKIINAAGNALVGAIPFVGKAFKAAMDDSAGNHLFLTTVYDQNGYPELCGGSPGPGYATTFIIELIPAANQPYFIESRQYPGYVLDVYNWSTENGADVNLWTRNGGGNQKFLLEATNDGYFTVKNLNSGKVLDYSSQLKQWDSNGGKHQQFKLVPAGDGYYYLEILSQPGNCLEAKGENMGLTLGAMNGSYSQMFRFDQ